MVYMSFVKIIFYLLIYRILVLFIWLYPESQLQHVGLAFGQDGAGHLH